MKPRLHTLLPSSKQLKCPGVDLIKPILDKLFPGGIIGGDVDTFGLEIPNRDGSIEHINTLVVYAHELSKQFMASVQSFSVHHCYLTQGQVMGYLLSGLASQIIASQSTMM